MVGFWAARDEDFDPALVAELYGIYLLPECWSMGYGKQLYGATETRIRQSLVANLVLWVFEKNAITLESWCERGRCVWIQ